MLSTQDALFLSRCMQLAALGGQAVLSNPLVGSVVVYKGKIIGEGYHQKLGGPHAEVHAVKAVSEPELLRQSTLYVNLEPCSIHGRTPPCADLIIRVGIPKVVIGCLDPNPKVSGRGVRRLRDAGVEVVLANDPKPFIELNKRFFVNQLLRRPLISLKWAASANGFIAGYGSNGKLKAEAITAFEANSFTHRLRAQHHAILVGRNTAAVDDPMLTNRHYFGGQPIRMVLDRHRKLPISLRLFHSPPFPTWLITKTDFPSPSVHTNTLLLDPWPKNLTQLFELLYTDYQIYSILIEGGKELHEALIAEELFDDLYVFQGNKVMDKGLPAPSFPANLPLPSTHQLGKDKLWHFDLLRFEPR